MNRKLIRIIITAFLLWMAWLLTRNSGWAMSIQLAVYLVPYLLISYDVLGEAWEGIREGDPFDEDFLMCIATVGALLIGFLPGAEQQMPEAVFVMLFFQIGELFEDYAEDKSRGSITELMDIRPDSAHVIRQDKMTTVAPEEVKVGEMIVVQPGEKVPMDGIVVEGDSSLNTVALTGESIPRRVLKGDTVISGCVNVSGVLKVRVEKIFGESTSSRIIDLVEHASENKSRSETFIHKFAHIYTPIVVALAVSIAFIPPFFYDSYTIGLTVWLYRALSFLVVSCPCALVISVPLTFFAGIGGASRKGILVKGGNYMDTLSRLSVLVFDKTGTLTQGVFAVDAVHPDKISKTELLHLAAHVERYSPHPIAAALREAYPDEADDCRVEQAEEVAGQGVKAVINGKTVSVGNRRMMAAGDVTVPEYNRKEPAGTVVHVAIDGEYAGHILISDRMKKDAAKVLLQLKSMGVKRNVMLTGDHQEAAAFVAGQIGVDAYYSELMPADKVAHVEAFLKEKPEKGSLGFVGDGINDAPVLARADVGIAMGGLGSDAAIEAADVVLMDDELSKIPTAISIARRTLRIAHQNAGFAIFIKVLILLLVALGVLGTLAMPLAVFGDVGVMVICVINAMRALRVS